MLKCIPPFIESCVRCFDSSILLSKTDIVSLITNKIGLNEFTDRINRLSKTLNFLEAKKTKNIGKNPLYYDQYFTSRYLDLKKRRETKRGHPRPLLRSTRSTCDCEG